MNSTKNKIKEDVLQELIDLMESKEVEGLKSKSPKFAKVEVQANDPDDLEEGLEKAQDMVDKSEELENMQRLKDFKGDAHDRHMDMINSLDGGMKNKMFQGHMDANKFQQDDDDEDLERLKELYSKIK